MSDTLRDLITRTLLANGTVTCAARADAILAALDAAGWTIVKRRTNVVELPAEAFEFTAEGFVSPLEIDCPTCGAKGTPFDAPKRYRCRTLKTNRSTDTHVARWDACYPPSALYAPDEGNHQ